MTDEKAEPPRQRTDSVIAALGHSRDIPRQFHYLILTQGIQAMTRTNLAACSLAMILASGTVGCNQGYDMRPVGLGWVPSSMGGCTGSQPPKPTFASCPDLTGTGDVIV